MNHWDLSQKSTFRTALIGWPIVICIPELGINIKQFYYLLNSRVGIYLSFPEYVEVVDKFVIMNMLPMKVTKDHVYLSIDYSIN